MPNAFQGLRLAFAGTPDFAAQILTALLKSQHRVITVYSQPDRPAGRGRKLQPSAVKQLALAHHLPIYQPAHLKDQDSFAALNNTQLDILIVVAYGLIIPANVLKIPRLGALNVHASLLPRWRGAAPIQRAIEAGDSHTGITIMQMDKGLDTGAILAKRSVILDKKTTAGQLSQILAPLGAQTLIETLDLLATDPTQINPEVQNDAEASYAHKLSKYEAQLDFRLPANQLAAKIRAFNPSPIAWANLAQTRLRIWQAHAISLHELVLNTVPTKEGSIIHIDQSAIYVLCGEDCLAITHAQLAGHNLQEAASLINGHHSLFSTGQCFNYVEATE